MKNRKFAIGTSKCHLCGTEITSNYYYCPKCRVKGWYLDREKLENAGEEAYMDLAGGILRVMREDYYNKSMRPSIMRFMRSSWFTTLSGGLSPEYVLNLMERRPQDAGAKRAVKAERVKMEHKRQQRRVDKGRKNEG